MNKLNESMTRFIVKSYEMQKVSRGLEIKKNRNYYVLISKIV